MSAPVIMLAVGNSHIKELGKEGCTAVASKVSFARKPNNGGKPAMDRAAIVPMINV